MCVIKNHKPETLLSTEQKQGNSHKYVFFFDKHFDGADWTK